MTVKGSFEERLGELNSRFKLGQFDGELFDSARAMLESTTSRRPALTDRLWLKCRCVLAEIFDQQGNVAQAQQAVKDGEKVYSLLASQANDSSDPALVREQVRFVADYARFHLYRRSQFAAAKDRLEHCERVISSRLPQPELHYGTLGLVHYYIGCAERQLGNLDKADESYGKAIDLYRRRAETAASVYRGPRRVEEMTLAHHNLAVILGLGLGWTNSQRGLLRKALFSNIIPAQLLLVGTGDATHVAYLSLIRSSIMRTRAGWRDADALVEAAAAAEAAYRTFITPPYCHKYYAARAAHELSLCKVASGDFTEACAWITTTDNLATELGDDRWKASACIVRSRLARDLRNPKRNFDQALAEATEAIRLMDGQEERLGLIDANIAAAEALMEQGNPEEARKNLAAALNILKNQQQPNPKIESVLHVHFARSYALDGDAGMAGKHLARWTALKDNVEHTVVHELAMNVEKKVESLKDDFLIRWLSQDLASDLKYRAQHDRLRRWLITRAYQAHEGKPQDEVAKALGIPRPTLLYWQKRLGVDVGKRRQKKSR